MSFVDIMRSPIGTFCVLIIRMIICSITISAGINMFNFKKFSPFFTFKRIVSIFLLLFGGRLLFDILLYFMFK